MNDKIYKNARAILQPNLNIFERIMGLTKLAKKTKSKGHVITVPKEFFEKLPKKKGYTTKGK